MKAVTPRVTSGLSELDVSIPLPLQGLIDEATAPHLNPGPTSLQGDQTAMAIVGGDDGKIGAAILASRAALRLRAGRVKTSSFSPQTLRRLTRDARNS